MHDIGTVVLRHAQPSQEIDRKDDDEGRVHDEDDLLDVIVNHELETAGEQ